MCIQSVPGCQTGARPDHNLNIYDDSSENDKERRDRIEKKKTKRSPPPPNPGKMYCTRYSYICARSPPLRRDTTTLPESSAQRCPRTLGASTHPWRIESPMWIHGHQKKDDVGWCKYSNFEEFNKKTNVVVVDVTCPLFLKQAFNKWYFVFLASHSWEIRPDLEVSRLPSQRLQEHRYHWPHCHNGRRPVKHVEIECQS